VQSLEPAGRRDAINRAAPGVAIDVVVAAGARRAVKKAVRGEQQLTKRTEAFVVCKIVKRGEFAGRGIDGEYCAAIELTALDRAAIEATVRPNRQGNGRMRAVGAIEPM